jgi:hypothetical protein
VRQGSGYVVVAISQTELIEHQQNLLVQRHSAARKDERAKRVLSLQRQQEVMSRPANQIVPSDGDSAPAMHFNSVLLPEPFGPIRP